MGIMTISSLGRAKLNEKFFVDTNIWVNVVYIANKAIDYPQPLQEKLNGYSDFIQKVKQDGGNLYTSALCLSELGHYIEREAHKIYQLSHTNIDSLKKFRAIPAQRKIIVNDIEQAWEDIKSLAEILPFTTNKCAGDNIIQSIKKYPLDAYDALFLNTMKQHNIQNIITDDKDFQPIAEQNEIDIYTI